MEYNIYIYVHIECLGIALVRSTIVPAISDKRVAFIIVVVGVSWIFLHG